MKRLLPVLFATVLALLVVGCQGGGGNVVGTYKLQMPAGSQPMPMDFTLELKPDNTFKLLFLEGTYTVSGDTVQATPTKMGSVDVKPEDRKGNIVFKIEDGGNTLVPQSSSGTAMLAEVAGAKFVKQ